MMQLSVTTEGKSFAETLKLLQAFNPKQFQFAQVVAASRIAEDIHFVLIREMKRVFDRPSPYTLNSLFVRYATKTSPEAYVSFKDYGGKGNTAGKYLQPQVYGGPRSLKRAEKALMAFVFGGRKYFLTPGHAAELDAYGNVPRNVYVKVLSALRAFSEVGYLANRRGSKRKGKPLTDYFVIAPDTVDAKRLNPGIYQRVGTGHRLIFNITKKEPVYRKRLDFFGIGQQVAKDQFERRFLEAFDKAIRTAR